MASRPENWQHASLDIQGKRVVVTGGTGGIGRATARLLSQAGARVFIYSSMKAYLA